MLDLARILYLVGAGFLVLNLHIAYQFFKFRRQQPSALLTWDPPRPPLYRLFL